MDDLSFSQPERRNFLVPILIALVILGIAGLLIVRLTPHTTADVAVTRAVPYQSHIVFKSESIVVGSDQSQDDLYVLATLRITNHLHLPLFIKDFNATLIPGANDPAGNLPLTTSAVEKPDLPQLLTSFPALAKLSDSQGSALLLRDTRIEPNQTVEGYVVLHFPTTQATWDQRQDATISIALYHQPSLTAAIPKSAAAPTASSGASPAVTH